MGIFSPFRTAEKKSLRLILFLGKDGVEALLLLAGPDGKYSILDSKFGPAPEAAKIEALDGVFQSIINKVLHSLFAKMAARSALGARLRLEAHCFFGAPFAFSAVVPMAKESPEAFLISEKMVAELLKSEENSLSEARSQSGQTGDFEIIEKNIVRASINGYPVRDFISREANVFRAEAYFGAVEMGSRLRTEEVVRSIFPDAKIFSHTADLAVFSELGRLLPDTADYIYCLIAHRRTEVISVKGGVPAGRTEFPIGGHEVFKIFNKGLSLAKPVASSYVRLYREKKLHSHSEDLIKKNFQAVSENWTKEFLTALNRVTSDIVMPKYVFLVPVGESDSVLAEEVRARDGSISLAGQFSVEVVDERKMNLPEFRGLEESFGAVMPMLVRAANRPEFA